MGMPGDLRRLAALDGFPRIFGTRVVSQFADGVLQASLASAVFFNPDHATTAAQAAAGFAVLFLPYSLIGPFAGVLLDRWRRARVLFVANLVRAALVVATAGALVAAGPTSLAYYGLALAAIGVNRFFLTALGASLPEIVPAADLVGANSVTTTLGFASTVLGGAVGVGVSRGIGHAAVARGDAGNTTATLLAAALYLASATVAAGFSANRLGPAEPSRVPVSQAIGTVLHGFADGMRHLRTRPAAGRALGVLGVHRVAYGISTVTIVLLYRNTLTGWGPFATGLPGAAQTVVAGGAGAVLAAVITPPATRRMHTSTWIAIVMLVAAVGVPAFGLTYTAAGIVAGSFLLGVCSQGLKICVDTILQRRVDEQFRGRIFALSDMVFNVAFVAAASLAALWLPESGRQPAVVAVVGALYGVGAVVYWLASRRDRVGPPLAAPRSDVTGGARLTPSGARGTDRPHAEGAGASRRPPLPRPPTT